jgi:hypothetical protein
MATLTELQARRDALEAALASGVLKLREGDKEVSYRNLDEMSRVLASVVAQIAALEGTVKTRRVYPQTRKGW